VALTRVVGKPADDGHDTPHVRRVISNCGQRFQYQTADHLPAAKKQSLRSSHVCRRYPTGPTSAVTDHAPGVTHPQLYDRISFTDQQARPNSGRRNYVRRLAPDISGYSVTKLASFLLVSHYQAGGITCMTYTYCCVYSTRLLMMARKPVRNM